jgi:hypothetical protein
MIFGQESVPRQEKSRGRQLECPIFKLFQEVTHEVGSVGVTMKSWESEDELAKQRITHPLQKQKRKGLIG